MVKRILFVLLAALAVGGAVFALRRGSDEDQIREKLGRLAAALHVEGGSNVLVRGVRIRREFDALFEEDVRTEIPELPIELAHDREALADEATELSTMFGTFEVSFGDVEVKMDDAKATAQVGATAKLEAKGRGETRRDTRSVDFLFRKQNGDWRIASINVWAKNPE